MPSEAGGGVEREKSGREETFKFSPSMGQPVGTEVKMSARLGGMVSIFFFFFELFYLFPLFFFFSFFSSFSLLRGWRRGCLNFERVLGWGRKGVVLCWMG